MQAVAGGGGLNPAVFGQGEGLTFSDDDVVQNADLDQRQDFDQARRQHAVGAAGLGGAGRVVVAEDNCGGVVCQCLDHHFTGYTEAPSMLPKNNTSKSSTRCWESRYSRANTSW